VPVTWLFGYSGGSDVEGAAARLAWLARGLARGYVTPDEVAPAALDALAEAADRAGAWAGAPGPVRAAVLAYLARVGPAGVPPPVMIGPAGPEWVAAQHARRQAVAAEVLAGFAEPGAAADRAGRG
jgi:hypothetical protein